MSKHIECISIKKRLYPDENDCSIISDRNILIRYEQSVKWYIIKANYNKVMYYIFSILGIVFPSIIIVVNSFSECNFVYSRIIITIVSVLSTIVSSVLTLFKFHKKWIHYRFIAETLQAELSLYSQNIGEYDIDENTRNKIFTIKIENIMKNEIKGWTKIVNKTNTKGSNN